MTLTQKTTTGVLWNFGEQFARRGIGVVITLLLAYFLVPEDYGLVAMMAVFLALGNSLMDSGFKQALIRLKNATQTDLNTAFYANIALGFLSYLLLFVAAPFVADFYDQPKLILLIRVASVAVIINAFQVVQVAVLSRDLNFKAQLKANLPAALISGLCALALAYLGHGVWALIAQMVIASFVLTALLWKQALWRPTLAFDLTAFKSMYRFGYKLFLSGVLDTVFISLYVIVIAKLFTPGVAGFYFFASQAKDLVVSQLVSSIQTVTYPALASVQDDPVRLKNGYRKVIEVTTFLLFPALLFITALAQPLFGAILPDKWLPAALYLQFLCIVGLLYPLHSINLNILQVKGRSDLFLLLEIVKKCMIVIIILISYRYGILGILYGQIVSSVLAYIPNSYFSSKLIDYPIVEQIGDFAPGLILAALIAMLVYGFQLWLQWPAIVELVTLGILAGGCYIACAHFLKLSAYMMAKEMVMKRVCK